MALTSGFREHARRRPGGHALHIDRTDVTYGDMDRMARRMAGHILDEHGTVPPLVGVLAGRSVVGYVAPIAVGYLGATYVPLRLDNPIAKVLRQVELTGIDIIVADVAGRKKAWDLVKKATRPIRIVDGSLAIHYAHPLRMEAVPSPDDIAYVMFTSGSTGDPKGVPIRHRNVDAFLRAIRDRYNIGNREVVAQLTDLSFDLSVLATFGAWDGGACVAVLHPDQVIANPRQVLSSAGVTVWISVPSLATMLTARHRSNELVSEALRLSVFCGEPLRADVVQRWRRATGDGLIDNLYGPTEATVACTGFWCNRDRPDHIEGRDTVPIGWPLGQTSIELLDENGLTAGRGEILVSGPQVFDGYWESGSSDATTFVEIEGADGHCRKYYRTGDVGYRDRDGCLHFIGRLDHQVKVRGYRVELGEVESALRQLDGVDDAVCIVSPDGKTRTIEISAIIVGSCISTFEIRRGLIDRLPLYAIPTRVVVADEIPRNANGKVDRRAASRMLGDGSSIV